MDIYSFAEALSQIIKKQTPSANLKNEAAFERKYIAEPAWELSEKNPEIRVFVHPEKRKAKCRGGCDAGKYNFSCRVKGCPDCWADSKDLSEVKAFDTKHNFDIVAIDKNSKTLAVEVKWLSLSSSRGPNGEFQRFIGQCAIAASVNKVVIGVCGFRGKRKKEYHEHDSFLRNKLSELGIILIPVYAKE